jgi:hypothetical protein
MDCADVQDELVAYHFASAPAEARDAVREHLRSCLACAQSYFDLKQDIDCGAELGVTPSATCEARLRRDVEVWLLPATRPPAATESPRQRVAGFWGWLAQPMPRYRAVLGAAMLCVLATAAATRLRPTEPGLAGEGGSELQPLPVHTPVRGLPVNPPGLPSPYCEIDSARMQALSITYY